jgi:DedD protein
MDTQPAPPLRDIQVRIPSPVEGETQNVAPPPRPAAPKPTPAAEESPRPISKPEPPPKPVAAAAEKAVPAEKPAAPASKADGEAKRAQEALEGKSSSAESWEVQLGAYQGAGSVSNLVGKLKQLGVPTYTEKVETANGPRTRVRAGPFPTRDAAEKAQARIKKVIGVDGPVAQKP